MKTKYKLKEEPRFGYKHLYPLPSERELKEFYEEEYYRHIQKTERSGHEKKLISKSEDVRLKEIEWLQKTYFVDKLDIFNKFFALSQRKILDIGCGTGEFLEFMKESGWKVVGIEPSKEAFKKAKEKRITVYNLSLDKFISQENKKRKKFNVVILDNVLEHVLAPQEVIMNLKKILKPRGIIYIRVPNDFNRLQSLASQKVDKKKWWVITPDHINYFNFQSLEKLLKFYGFEILFKTTDFPMELFLLMGENYVDNPEIGKLCHQKRVNFELFIPKELRRSIYDKLVKLGLGRECIIYARSI